MTWIRPPKKRSPVIPLTYRQIMGYDRILVGTDGSPSSMLAVERAGQVASASEAELVVVTAYDPVPARDAAILNLAVGNLREHQIRGQDHAMQTLEGTRPWPRPGQGLACQPRGTARGAFRMAVGRT